MHNSIPPFYLSPRLCPALFLFAGALAAWPTSGKAQTQLLLNPQFTTTPAIAAGNFSQDVGRSGSGAAFILDGTTGLTGWRTTDSAARFEVWTPGYLGSPTGVGNTLELASTSAGSTISQSVTSLSNGLPSAVFSFGYSTRDNGNDRFTLTITDTTAGTTLLTQAFNPTGSFATNNVYSQNLTLVPGDTYNVAFLDQNTTGFLNLSAGTTSAHIANVSFIQAIPEPSTYALAAAGSGLLFAVLKRRRA